MSTQTAIDPASIDSLVVRCPNWVGDIVMATPVFECLRDNFPKATITALIRPYARGIIEDGPWFDHIVPCQDKTWSGLMAIRRELKALKPQLGLLLTNTTHSFLTFKLAGVPHTVGYKRNFRRHFLSGGPEPITENGRVKPLPMQDYYLELCNYLGLEQRQAPRARLYMSPEIEAEGAKRLAHYGITDSDLLIGLNPGASFGSSKCWPPDYFAQLAERLQADYGCKLLLLVGPGEEDIAAEIVAKSTADIIDTAADRIDLAALKPLIKRCDLLITNDTGPRHYAVAFEVPNIVLMGPTNPTYTASNLQSTQVLRKELPCVPCHKKRCPLGHHECMTSILPQEVIQASHAVIGGVKP